VPSQSSKGTALVEVPWAAAVVVETGTLAREELLGEDTSDAAVAVERNHHHTKVVPSLAVRTPVGCRLTVD
jgi:hypothetical protein